MGETTSRSVTKKRHPRALMATLNGGMTRLGELLRLYRAVHNIGLRELAEDIGVHFNTLNRFERTDTGMTADSFLKILVWLLRASPKTQRDTP